MKDIQMDLLTSRVHLELRARMINLSSLFLVSMYFLLNPSICLTSILFNFFLFLSSTMSTLIFVLSMIFFFFFSFVDTCTFYWLVDMPIFFIFFFHSPHTLGWIIHLSNFPHICFFSFPKHLTCSTSPKIRIITCSRFFR